MLGVVFAFIVLPTVIFVSSFFTVLYHVGLLQLVVRGFAQVMRWVILPLSWPGFLTAGLVIGLFVWNEFLFAVTFLQQPELKPIATSLFAFQERFSRDWGLTSAGAVIMMFPVVILFLLLQRRFIEGLTQGGLKA